MGIIFELTVHYNFIAMSITIIKRLTLSGYPFSSAEQKI